MEKQLIMVNQTKKHLGHLIFIVEINLDYKKKSDMETRSFGLMRWQWVKLHRKDLKATISLMEASADKFFTPEAWL